MSFVLAGGAGEAIAAGLQDSGLSLAVVEREPRSKVCRVIRLVCTDSAVTISKGGGNKTLAWRAGGKELWYGTAEARVMAVSVTTTRSASGQWLRPRLCDPHRNRATSAAR